MEMQSLVEINQSLLVYIDYGGDFAEVWRAVRCDMMGVINNKILLFIWNLRFWILSCDAWCSTVQMHSCWMCVLNKTEMVFEYGAGWLGVELHCMVCKYWGGVEWNDVRVIWKVHLAWKCHVGSHWIRTFNVEKYDVAIGCWIPTSPLVEPVLLVIFWGREAIGWTLLTSLNVYRSMNIYRSLNELM